MARRTLLFLLLLCSPLLADTIIPGFTLGPVGIIGTFDTPAVPLTFAISPTVMTLYYGDVVQDHMPTPVWCLTCIEYSGFLPNPGKESFENGGYEVTGMYTGFANSIFFTGRDIDLPNPTPIIGTFAVNSDGTNMSYTIRADIDLPDSAPSSVPEPSTLLLLGSGMAGLVARVRRR